MTDREIEFVSRDIDTLREGKGEVQKQVYSGGLSSERSVEMI